MGKQASMNQSSRMDMSLLSDNAKKAKDDFTMDVISMLNNYIREAHSTQCGPVARILHNAKEELIFWAVQMEFHETPAEKFINRHLYQSNN